MNGLFANLNKKNKWMGLCQKPWVGLTDDEQQQAYELADAMIEARGA